MNSTPSRLACLSVLTLLIGTIAAASTPLPADDRVTVFTGATIIPISGPAITTGRLIVRGSTIAALGPDSPDGPAIPPGATVIDAAGKTIMPGLVDTHSHIGGVGGADSSAPIQPDVRVADSINVRDSGFRRAAAGGITTLNVMAGSGHLLSGQTVYLKLRAPARARTIDDLAYRAPDGSLAGGMKMANGTNSIGAPPYPGTRGKSAALIREQYVRAQEYADKLARAIKKDDAGNLVPDLDKRPARDLALEALGSVLRGERIVQHHTHRADDIMTVLRFAKEFNCRVVLHHVSEAWKVAPEIAAADTGWGSKGIKGTPVSAIVVDAPGGKLEAAELSWETGAILERAGVTVAFHTDDWITDSRLFLRSAALAVRAGMSRDGALAALTLSGAKMLDLESRVGSLEPGKDADFIILSGDPLSVYTKVEQTWTDGEKIFDRADPKDRLYAVGGLGAGHDQAPYLCCYTTGVIQFGGKQWGVGGGAHDIEAAAP